jgi:allophanate hydrolase subunit 1
VGGVEMANKSHQLLNGWTLIAHNSYKLFSNENSYVLLDQDDVVSMQFTATEQEFEVINSNYDLRFKMIPAFKTIKVLSVPDEL